MELDELNELNATQWRKLLDKYLYSSKEAAKVLEVSVPRVFQLEHTGLLNSVDKGRYLKREVESVKEGLQKRRKKYRKDEEVITAETVYNLIVSMYRELNTPISPREIEKKVQAEISGASQVNVQYRVTNIIRILLKKDQLIRVGRGAYKPVGNAKE